MMSAIAASGGFRYTRYAIEPAIVSVERTTTMTESVVAWPICSVLNVSCESIAAEEPRSK